MVTIRDAVEQDLPGIFAIYDREVVTGTCTFDTEPKSIEQRGAWLREHASPRYPAIVAVDDAGGRGGAGGGLSAGRRCRPGAPGARMRGRLRTRSTCTTSTAGGGSG